MAINLKKFIAVLSSLAITASVMPVALAAETPDDNGVYYNEDFSTIPAGTLVNLGSTKNDTYSDALGVTFTCRGRNDDQTAQGISVSNGAVRLYANKYVGADQIQPTITLDWTNGATFANDRVMSFDITGAAGTEVVVTDSAKSELTIPLPSAKKLNCNIYSKTEDLTTYVILYDAETSEVVKTITSETVLVDFATITATKNKSFSYTLDNLVVQDASVDIPVIELEDITRVEVGTSLKVATLMATDYDIQLSNPTDFSYYVDGTDVYLTASENASTGAKTTVTITGKGTVDITKVSGEISALTQDEIVQEAYDELVLSGMGVTLVDGTEYTVTSSFDLPVPSNSAVEVSWSASLSGYAKVNDTSVKVTKSEAMEGETVTLTATISYGEVSVDKVFTLDLSFNPKDVYYDESFDGFPSGTVVNLSNTENTSYVASNGMSFACGERSGNGDEIGAIINATGDDKFLTLANSNYTGQGRRPIVTFTRKVAVTNNLVIKLDARFAAADDDLLLYDSSSNMLTLNVPEESYAGKWLSFTIIGAGSGKVKILVKDADGKAIDYYTGDSTLKGVATMSLTDTNASTVAVNNLYIADDTETIADADIVAAAKANLDIDDLTHKGGIYTATTDFDLPDDPEGTEVTWTAMQKAKDGSEWESSSFIKISGTKAVINPTKDIDSYDVKLVATITAGEATDTTEFVIDLPNPMDEINGILNNKFNIVNTTDFDTSLKTITFDLNGEDMLKRDLALPISYKKYENTKIAWTSSDPSHISIADNGTATVMTSDFKEHEVTLTAVVTYKKDDVTYSSDEQKFTVKMGFEESDKTSGDATMGKYRVRYDAAYEDNFDIPKASTSNITLPTDGYFGSEFKWTSSAPTIISNAGKLTRPATTRTVTLTADIISGSASGTAEFKVTVQGTSSSGSSGGGGGGGTASTTGVVNKGTSSGTISTPTSTVVVPADSTTSATDTIARLQEEALAANDLFTDISKAAWARDAINGLAKAGVINGKSDTEFAPNDTVTRAEFAKMLMGAFGLASDAYTTSSFNDVPTGEWYFQFVESAYNLGIIQGTASGTFEPNALITRQDMAVMVARAAQIAGKDLAAVRDMLGFADGGRIASYAAEAVEQLVKAGAMSGKSDTEFAPLENATRAQAAQILFNLVG